MTASRGQNECLRSFVARLVVNDSGTRGTSPPLPTQFRVRRVEAAPASGLMRGIIQLRTERVGESVAGGRFF